MWRSPDLTDHVDWSNQFVGWGTVGSVTPEGLVRQWIAQVDAAAEDWSDVPLDPDGVPVPAVYVTAEGLDLKQLLEKFLRGAVAFSQGADDYLDDDVEGKGLLADHDAADDTDNYTPLEHAWDEGFGYFGASRTYGSWTDDQIADAGYADVDSDGSIDLKREMSWGHSANAAKRDLGAVQATDFTQEAWDGFRGGWELIAGWTADPTPTELDALRGFRDQAVSAWEKAIASTVVHYINDVIQDMDAIGGDAYDFGDHAKHWGEMKGFALSFQFNPRSPLDAGAFQQLHALLGDAPVLSDADQPTRDQYVADLLAARALIRLARASPAAVLIAADCVRV